MSLQERLPGDSPAGAHAALSTIKREAISLRTSIVTLSGEHDVLVKQQLLKELSRTTYAPRLIVDLTPCTFIDSTILATLLRFRRFGSRQVEFVVPHDGEASRTLNLAGVDILARIYRTLEEALSAEPSTPWRSPQSTLRPG
jgi:anti-anti-sigma factor